MPPGSSATIISMDSSSDAGADRRSELLAIAVEVFGESGFAGARIDDIAHRAGIRRPSVLYHFPDKATLYFAAIAEVIRDVAARVEQTRQVSGDRLIVIADHFVDFVIDRPHAARLLLRQMIDARPVDAENLARAPLEALLATLQQAIDADPRPGKPVDASEFALILSSTSLVWVAGRSAVEDVIGLDTLSPEAVDRHRRTLHALVRQLLLASSSDPHAPRSIDPSPRTDSTASVSAHDPAR